MTKGDRASALRPSLDSGSALFEEYFDRLTALVRQRLEIEQRAHRLDHLEGLKADLSELQREFGALLRVVFRYGLVAALREEARWYAAVLANRRSPHDALELLLDSWIVAIQGLVQPPQCNLLAAPLKALRAELPTLLSDTPPSAAVDAQVQELLRTLIAGDLAGARGLVRRRLDAGVLAHDLVPGLLLATMAQIGSGWEQDTLSIFEEHLATETLVRLLAELPAMVPRAQSTGRSFGFSTAIAVLIGVVIISLTMYTSVLGRSRDFAVLRAMGGRRWDVAVVVISEALIITGAGLFLRFLLLATLLNATRGAQIPSYFPANVPPILAGATVLVSLLGSLVALRVALRAEPASVFH